MPIAEETPIKMHSRSPIYSPDTPLARVIRCVSAEPALSPAVMDEVEITAADVCKPSNHLPDRHSTHPGKRAPCQDLLSQLLPSIPRVPVTSRIVLFHPPSPRALMLNRVNNTLLTPGSRQRYQSHTCTHTGCCLINTAPMLPLSNSAVGLNLM